MQEGGTWQKTLSHLEQKYTKVIPRDVSPLLNRRDRSASSPPSPVPSQREELIDDDDGVFPPTMDDAALWRVAVDVSTLHVFLLSFPNLFS